MVIIILDEFFIRFSGSLINFFIRIIDLIILFTIMQGSKNVYTAEIVAIQDFFGKTKAEASLAMTYYFIVYGIMQVCLAPILSKINLKIFLLV